MSETFEPSPLMAGVSPIRRCRETRAHYAHEWYNPLRQQLPRRSR